MKVLEETVNDDLRLSLLDRINKRIKKGKSILIVGEFGSGKTNFLNQIKTKHLAISKVESLGALNYFLASILRQRQYTFTPKINKSVEYLQAICAMKNQAIIIDDGQDIRPIIFRYIKRMMDANIPIIMSGTPEVETMLKERNEDVLCRMKVFKLLPLSIKELKQSLPQFEPDILDIIYGESFGNIWIFKDICEDCLDEMVRQKRQTVGIEILQKYLT